MSNSNRLTRDSLPFAQPGRFYRGNLHGHSTNSDGAWSPAEYCRRYRHKGYDFVALTDHYAISDTRAFRSDDFTTLIGAELHPGQIESGSAWHLLVLGLPLDFETSRPGDSGGSLARRAMVAGAFVAAAHPYWYSLTLADFETLGGVDAVECYNGNCDWGDDRGYSWQFIDMLLHRGHRVSAIAVDDAHAKGNVRDYFRGWVHVKAESLTPAALLRALKTGRYYSSTGPQIHHVEVGSSGEVLVACSPVEQIYVTGSRAGSRRHAGEGLTSAAFNLQDLGESPWFRVTVRDGKGRRAWTNPVWLA